MELVEGSELYLNQLRLDDGEVRIGFMLSDTGEAATLNVGKVLTVSKGGVEQDLLIEMSSSVFTSILHGNADAAALMARSSMSDIRPINFKIVNTEKAGQVWETAKSFMNVFFLPGRIKSKPLGKEFAGEAHGARPIPLAYWNGMRSAWYHVPEGSTLNEDGERDPYPQAFVVLNGEGKLILEGETCKLERGTVYYIPVDSVHIVSAETEIELIWIAWDTPP